MFDKLKPRKCRKCKAEYTPKVKWQEFCGERCRTRTKTARRAKILRQAQKIIEAQEKGAA
jgi:hypothetical protein